MIVIIKMAKHLSYDSTFNLHVPLNSFFFAPDVDGEQNMIYSLTSIYISAYLTCLVWHCRSVKKTSKNRKWARRKSLSEHLFNS